MGGKISTTESSRSEPGSHPDNPQSSVTAEQLRAHERSENVQARGILAREQATHARTTRVVLGDPTMVDPEASTRPEAPIGESDRHDADSFVGPHTPKTGDSSSEDELEYKGSGPDLEFKLYE